MSSFLFLPMLGCSGGDHDPVPVLDMAVADMGGGDMVPIQEMDTRIREIGERCGNPKQCGDEAACTGDKDQQNFRCMLGCTEPGRICGGGGGEVCVALSQSATLPAVCFLGGGVEKGARCDSNLECVAAHSCFGTQDERYCIKACHQADEDTCGPGSTCLVGEGRKGFCRQLTSTACAQDTECLALDASLVCSTSFAAQGAGAILPMASCTRECVDDASCPQGAVCRGLKSGVRLCLSACQSDAACRFNQGNVCKTREMCAGSSDVGACEALFAPAPGQGLCLGSVEM